MIGLFVAWRLFRHFRVTLAAGVVLALGIALLHGHFASAQHTLSSSGLSGVGRELQRGVQGTVQHALRPVPGTR